MPTKARDAERLVLVEFDNVLFRTPDRPRWWPFNGYEDMPQSLLPPCVDICSDAEDWINGPVAEEVMALQAATTFSVLHTFRTDAFKERVGDLLGKMPSPAFDSHRFRPVCKCCSRLGLTHTGEAGYGRIANSIVAHPTLAEDKHLLVILGDVLSDCAKANEVVLYLSAHDSRHKARGRFCSSQFARICRLFGADVAEAEDVRIQTAMVAGDGSVKGITIMIKGVRGDAHAAGNPTQDQLDAMQCWCLRRTLLGARTQTERAMHLESMRQGRAAARATLQARLARVSAGPSLAFLSLETLFPKGPCKYRFRKDGAFAARRACVRMGKKQLDKLVGCRAAMFYGDGNDEADDDGMFAPEFEPPRASSSVYNTHDDFGEIAFADDSYKSASPEEHGWMWVEGVGIRGAQGDESEWDEASVTSVTSSNASFSPDDSEWELVTEPDAQADLRSVTAATEEKGPWLQAALRGLAHGNTNRPLVATQFPPFMTRAFPLLPAALVAKPLGQQPVRRVAKEELQELDDFITEGHFKRRLVGDEQQARRASRQCRLLLENQEMVWVAKAELLGRFHLQEVIDDDDLDEQSGGAVQEKKTRHKGRKKGRRCP